MDLGGELKFCSSHMIVRLVTGNWTNTTQCGWDILKQNTLTLSALSGQTWLYPSNNERMKTNKEQSADLAHQTRRRSVCRWGAEQGMRKRKSDERKKRRRRRWEGGLVHFTFHYSTGVHHQHQQDRSSAKSTNRCFSSLSLSIMAKRLNRPPPVLFTLSLHPPSFGLLGALCCPHPAHGLTPHSTKTKGMKT